MQKSQLFDIYIASLLSVMTGTQLGFKRFCSNQNYKSRTRYFFPASVNHYISA